MMLCMSYETRLIYNTLCKAMSGMQPKGSKYSLFMDIFLNCCFSGEIKNNYLQSGNRLQ